MRAAQTATNCSVGNGNCDHECSESEDGLTRSCRCVSGYKLHKNGTKCEPKGEDTHLVQFLTAPLVSGNNRTVWQVVLGNWLEGTFPKYLAGDWINHLCITITGWLQPVGSMNHLTEHVFHWGKPSVSLYCMLHATAASTPVGWGYGAFFKRAVFLMSSTPVIFGYVQA